MPALVIIETTGERTGRVSAVLPADQLPGVRMVANASGKWRFVYIDNLDPGAQELLDLVKMEVDRASAAQTIRPRENYVNIFTLPTRPGRDFTTYAAFEDSTAYTLRWNQFSPHVRAENTRPGGRAYGRMDVPASVLAVVNGD